MTRQNRDRQMCRFFTSQQLCRMVTNPSMIFHFRLFPPKPFMSYLILPSLNFSILCKRSSLAHQVSESHSVEGVRHSPGRTSCADSLSRWHLSPTRSDLEWSWAQVIEAELQADSIVINFLKANKLPRYSQKSCMQKVGNSTPIKLYLRFACGPTMLPDIAQRLNSAPQYASPSPFNRFWTRITLLCAYSSSEIACPL
jgi:hypothetical protein